jgi:hypothetical protein
MITITLTFLEYRVISSTLPIAKIVFLSIVSTFSVVFAITPVALGVNEAFIVFSASILNILASQVTVIG